MGENILSDSESQGRILTNGDGRQKEAKKDKLSSLPF